MTWNSIEILFTPFFFVFSPLHLRWGAVILFAENIQYCAVPGKSSGHIKRPGSFIRPTSPKSPGASASAFDSVEGSDDEDNMTGNSKLDTTYLHINGNAVSF
jgi:hypothetical protein